MVKKQLFIVFDQVSAFERMIRSGELPALGIYRKSQGRYETANAVYQLARSLERVRGYGRDSIVLIHRKRNPLKSTDEMRYVLAAWPNVRMYGEE